MKPTIPEPGTSIASLLASITPEQIATHKRPDLKEPESGDTILGNMPPEAKSLDILILEVSRRIEEIRVEAHSLHKKDASHCANSGDTECELSRRRARELLDEISVIGAYHEHLAQLMWTSIRLHFGLRGKTNAILRLAKDHDGIVVVSTEKTVDIAFEIIGSGSATPWNFSELQATPAGPAN